MRGELGIPMTAIPLPHCLPENSCTGLLEDGAEKAHCSISDRATSKDDQNLVSTRRYN